MTRRCGKRRAKRKTSRSGMPRMLSRIDSFPLHRIAESVPSAFLSLLVRYIPSASPSLSLSLRTYSVFSSPRPIYLPPRVAEWILFVSHRYFSGPACRSSSKTVSPPRFMFPPTQRRIDPFLLSDVYVCGSVFLPRISPSRGSVSFHARARISRAHTTVCPRSSRSRWPPCPLASASFETSFQRFRHPPLPRSLLFFL